MGRFILAATANKCSCGVKTLQNLAQKCEIDSAVYSEIIPITCKHANQEFSVFMCLVSLLKPYLELSSIFEEWFHPTEIERLKGMKFSGRQQSYLVGRLAAKKALQAYFPTRNVSSFLIDSGVFSQPVVEGEGLSGIQVSISHKETFGVAVVCSEKHPVAIDIEKVMPEEYKVVYDVLTAKEKRVFFPIEELNLVAFYSLVWSVKEALGKVLKTGLAASWEIFEIDRFEMKGEGYVLTTYTHFPQYKCVSFIWQDMSVSLVFPRKSELFWGSRTT